MSTEPKDKTYPASAFRPILIGCLEVKLFKEDERGKHFILRNPLNSRYLKVHESIYEIVKLLDGSNTVASIQEVLKDKNIPITATDLLETLVEDGFIENLEGGGRTKQDPFSFKIRLLRLDDRHATKLHRLFFFVDNLSFRAFYSAFSIIGALLFITGIHSIASSASEALRPDTSLIFLLAFFPIVFTQGFAHELAHALVYHHYGGKSVTMGLESHFMIPFVFTATPDARWMTTKENVKIFLSGPLTSLFFAGVFTFLYFLDVSMRPLWALSALFSYLTVLLSLNPVFRTDGYFIAQAILKIPNLLEHGFSNLTQILRLILRRISLKDYRNYLSQYSLFERKVLMAYGLSVPVIAICLAFIGVVLGLYFGAIKILLLTSQILVGATLGLKAYVLWVLWLFGTITMLIGVTGTFAKMAKRTHKQTSRLNT